LATACDDALRAESATTTTPPRARRALQSLTLLLGLLLLARIALHFQLPIPACPLRAATGVPCPFCGGTRACAALAGLDFLEALRFNPLVALAVCGAGGLWVLALLRREDRLPKLGDSLGRSRVWKGLLALALLLNWLYLCLRLPH
jgi:hypothetical protein